MVGAQQLLRTVQEKHTQVLDTAQGYVSTLTSCRRTREVFPAALPLPRSCASVTRLASASSPSLSCEAQCIEAIQSNGSATQCIDFSWSQSREAVHNPDACSMGGYHSMLLLSATTRASPQ
jgi:hypothetical protein